MLVEASPVHYKRQVFPKDRLTGQRGVDEWRDIGPDLGPDVIEAYAQCCGVFGPKDLGVGIVVEEAKFRPPCDEHREPGTEYEADDRPE